MVSEVILGAGLRANLLSLQRTQVQIDQVQNILSTGLRVNSALDNPQNFFQAQSLRSSSNDLLRLLDGVGQSIQTVKAADAAVEAISSLLNQADSIVESAREALAAGQLQASITGNVNLAGKSSLTTISGISNTDDVYFEYYNTSGVLQTASIDIATGESTDDFIAEIKDIGGGGYFNAELTSEGFLKITEIRGGNFTVNFTADNNAAASNAADTSLASALGFGNQINATTRNGGAATNANAEITALATTKLKSGAFYETVAGQGFAEASDLLTGVAATDGGAARFAAAGAPNITFRINGTTTSANIAVSGTTIQGLVDAINTDVNVGNLIDASYDATTGQLSISAIDSSVKTITVTSTNTAAVASTVDFDFGTDTSFQPGAAIGDAEGETFTLASATATLGSLESDYNSILTQIDSLVEDAKFQGVNLLENGTLNTFFNKERTNKLTTQGANLSSSGLGLTAANFTTTVNIDDASSKVAAAKTTLQNFGASISNSLTIIQTRETFINDLVETNNEGADKLTLADQNEEGAKLLALQTRQQLGVTALSLAAQGQQSVLRLFAS
ncbi:MAG: flagellin [Proteobacteria bacterium]|nr:flagellin [Pseudomonadota bacterium]